jgi:geranylgeranyl diphosphate synthase type II
MISPSEVENALRTEAAAVDAWLAGGLKRRGAPEGLLAAMEYSLLAGGKRVRPALFLTTARMLVSDNWAKRLLPFAGAIECIHTYSLIHDDLPAMDNADLRRGKASCHKRFDEATAVLAGDALLTEAFALMGSVESEGVPTEWVLRAIVCMAEAAGTAGMAGGQFLDMGCMRAPRVSLEELAAMQAMKTGALLRAPCVAAALLCGADEVPLEAMARYGSAFGAAFQITDDILDVTGNQADMGKPVGGDAALRKITCASLLGVEESRRLAEQQAKEAVDALAGFSGPESDLLRGLAVYCINRLS